MFPTAVVVRPASPSDVSKLSAFLIEAWKEAGPGALGFAGATDEAIREIASEEFLRRRLASPTVHMVVAEEGERIIGFSSTRRVEEREAELSGIMVLESATGRGIGTRLLRKSLEAARKRGFTTVFVKTEVVNDRAIEFYKKAGFTESGKTVEKVGRTRVALRILVKKLR
jgi:ribosomal protein S18 acetylase RimI-like enzyme